MEFFANYDTLLKQANDNDSIAVALVAVNKNGKYIGVNTNLSQESLRRAIENGDTRSFEYVLFNSVKQFNKGLKELE